MIEPGRYVADIVDIVEVWNDRCVRCVLVDLSIVESSNSDRPVGSVMRCLIPEAAKNQNRDQRRFFCAALAAYLRQRKASVITVEAVDAFLDERDTRRIVSDEQPITGTRLRVIARSITAADGKLAIDVGRELP